MDTSSPMSCICDCLVILKEYGFDPETVVKAQLNQGPLEHIFEQDPVPSMNTFNMLPEGASQDARLYNIFYRSVRHGIKMMQLEMPDNLEDFLLLSLPLFREEAAKYENNPFLHITRRMRSLSHGMEQDISSEVVEADFGAWMSSF